MAGAAARRCFVRLRMRFNVRHVCGARRPAMGPDDVIALITVKNGAQYLPSFLDYHRALGVAHFAFLDNGSTDGTLDILRAAPDATVLATGVSYKKNDSVFAKYLVDRFGRGRWSLTLDIDEYFDYPYSDRIPLTGLIAYLRDNGYTAMLTQMLDMYRLKYRPDDDEAFHRDAHGFYELDTVEKEPYPIYYRSVCESAAVKAHWGGVRKRVFDFRPCISKHALLFRGEADRCPDNNHFVRHARVGDVTGVLYHYKFISGFTGLVAEGVRRGHYHKNSRAHRRYLDVMNQSEEIDFESEGSRKLQSVNELFENGFLVASEKFLGRVRRRR